MTPQEIENKYQELCATPSDINEHLPILRHYADKCTHVTEMGVRACVSLFAFLSSSAERVVAIDIFDVWVPDVPKLQFICADDLKIEIDPTDMLHVDTAHNYNQCIQELDLHAKNVSKYIAFHDTGDIFGRNGDDGGKGLLYAIEEFLEKNSDWQLIYQVNNNNGMTIIARR